MKSLLWGFLTYFQIKQTLILEEEKKSRNHD